MQNSILNSSKMMFKASFCIFSLWAFSFLVNPIAAQYWQQEANYKMKVQLDDQQHQIHGTQEIQYTNHSPDTLYRAFYHLYWNAFQPNSMMDVRSRNLPDPDGRVADRIFHLEDDEIGFQSVESLSQNGKPVDYTMEGTILEVRLSEPIAPGEEVIFQMEFVAQVPKQIRRSGRDNLEGIDYSMSQWYPKLCAYDRMGWHPNPYIAREFYGNWGDFEVEITAPSEFTIAAGAQLLNPESTLPRHGYLNQEQIEKGNFDSEQELISWKFLAENVHDFMWAADKDYQHDIYAADCGVEMHFFYQEDTAYAEQWKQLPRAMNQVFTFVNEHYGEYPYPVYSFIQGGDGGMEYPMGTLITGNRSYGSLVGVSVHELMHSWYQMMLGTDEARFAWMDEGFTSYASAHVMNHLKKIGILKGDPATDPMARSINGYANFMRSNVFEPLSTHSDHYNTNTAYGVASYTGGSVILDQLGYVLGEEVRDRGLLRYFEEWKFKLPTDDDFFRVMENESGIILDWYQQYMVHSTKPLDYAIDTVFAGSSGTEVTLKRVEPMPMPADLLVVTKDGQRYWYNIPLRIMRGHKPIDAFEAEYDSAEVLTDWPWTHPSYTVNLSFSMEEIESITLDPMEQTIDGNRSNNNWPLSDTVEN